LYNQSDFKSVWWQAIQPMTDSAFLCAKQRSASWMAAVGIDAYVYFFTHELEILKLVDPDIGGLLLLLFVCMCVCNWIDL
jgi:hypothetical protein